MTEATAPTFVRIDARSGWARGYSVRRGIAEADRGLRLEADPDGPLGLRGDKDAPGGLTLPRGFAFDCGWTLHLLVHEAAEDWRIKCFEPSSRRFVDVPLDWRDMREPGRLVEPSNIAIVGRTLVIADVGSRRLYAADLSTGRIRDLGMPRVPPDSANSWRPIDVVGFWPHVYVLDYFDKAVAEDVEGDKGRQRLWRVVRIDIVSDALEIPLKIEDPRDSWRRLLLDRQGCVYLHDPVAANLTHFPEIAGVFPRPDEHSLVVSAEAATSARKIVKCAGDPADRFDPPVLRLDIEGRFYLPECLAARAGRLPSVDRPAPHDPFELARKDRRFELIFDRHGNPATYDPRTSLSRPYYLGGRPSGTRALVPIPAGNIVGYEEQDHGQAIWIAGPIDSEIHDCQWHRIQLDIARLPPSTQVHAATHTTNSDEDVSTVEAAMERFWDMCYSAVGSIDLVETPHDETPHEFLVQSQEGRYLWLKLTMCGDGYDTPVVSSIRIHYPRQSYLDYLPAIYSANPDSRRFLEHFLSAFQTEWDKLEHRLHTFARYFDPDGVPGGAFLDYLASWLALPLEGEWTPEQRRALLRAAPRLYPKRGTLQALQEYVRVYLSNMVGKAAEENPCFPRVVEGFRLRNHIILGDARRASLGGEGTLWGAKARRRLRLDDEAREGEVRLVSTGDPDVDLFDAYAHFFRVLVPAAWVRNQEEKAMLCRAIDTEKPAHTYYKLTLVEPRMRVGFQSTLGFDTVIGGLPPARLGDRGERPSLDPTREPGGLGMKTISSSSVTTPIAWVDGPGA